MALTSPGGVSSVSVLARISEIFLAMEALVASGAKSELPGVGSRRICFARMEALATAFSAAGGMDEAAIEL